MPPPQPAHINPRNRRIEIPRSIEMYPALPALDVCMLRKKGGLQNCHPAASSSALLGGPSGLELLHWRAPRGGTSLPSTPKHCRPYAATQACSVPHLRPPPQCPRSSSGPHPTAETTAHRGEPWNPMGTDRHCQSRRLAPTRFQWEDAPPSIDRMHPPQTTTRPPLDGLPGGQPIASPCQSLPDAHLASLDQTESTHCGRTNPGEQTSQKHPRIPRYDQWRIDPHRSCELEFRPVRAHCHEKSCLPEPQQHPVERLQTKRVGR